jgi:hypothetical protein
MLKILKGKTLNFEEYCVLFYSKPSKYMDFVEKQQAEQDWIRIVGYLLHIGAFE